MKAIYAGIALASLSLAGVGYAQYAVKEAVSTELDQQLTSAALSKQLGHPVQVQVESRHDGWMTSVGRTLIHADLSPAAVDMVVDYQIRHSVLQGVQYEASVVQLLVGSQASEMLSINTEVFSNQPIRIIGKAELDGGSGQILIPAIRRDLPLEGDELTPENTLTVDIPAYPVDFAMSGYEQNRLEGETHISASIPTIRVTTADSGVEVSALDYQQNYKGSAGSLDSDQTIRIKHLKSLSSKPLEQLEMSGLEIGADVAIAKTFDYQFSVKLAEAVSPMGAISGLDIHSSMGGLDGKVLREFIQQLMDVSSSSSDPAVMLPMIMSFAQQRADELLAPGPVIEAKTRLDMNGSQFVDIKGKLKLETSKLPQDYFSQLAASGGDPMAMMMLTSVINAEVDAELSPMAAMLASQAHPMVAEIAQTGEPIAFRMSDGVATLNGQPLM
ncbi:DUF945 family protein [Oceanobacter mangrovi]|uniref:DUF945 family protein n=1 Tax=Oceanobacter mangrovi TaxID=2862510 RepID=UPI001C8E9145|nr:DUF945 family protein [Oceanobacter mangrovi]